LAEVALPRRFAEVKLRVDRARERTDVLSIFSLNLSLLFEVIVEGTLGGLKILLFDALEYTDWV